MSLKNTYENVHRRVVRNVAGPGNRFHSAGEVSIKLFSILYQLSNNATVYNGVRALSLSEIETEKSSPRRI